MSEYKHTAYTKRIVVPTDLAIYALAIMGDPAALDLIGWLRCMARIGIKGIECSR